MRLLFIGSNPAFRCDERGKNKAARTVRQTQISTRDRVLFRFLCAGRKVVWSVMSASDIPGSGNLLRHCQVYAPRVTRAVLQRCTRKKTATITKAITPASNAFSLRNSVVRSP